jgi:hypothetical protein
MGQWRLRQLVTSTHCGVDGHAPDLRLSDPFESNRGLDRNPRQQIARSPQAFEADLAAPANFCATNTLIDGSQRRCAEGATELSATNRLRRRFSMHVNPTKEGI